MFSLPPRDSELRELFDVAALAEMVAEKTIPQYADAVEYAKDFLASAPAATAVNLVAEMPNGVWLIRVDRDTETLLWRFGQM